MPYPFMILATKCSENSNCNCNGFDAFARLASLGYLSKADFIHLTKRWYWLILELIDIEKDNIFSRNLQIHAQNV